VVELVTVELDHQVRLRPVRVHEITVDEHAHLRHPQAGAADQIEEESLELRLGLCGGLRVVLEQRRKAGRAAPAVGAGEHAAHRRHVEDLQPLRSLPEALKLGRGRRGREVEERAGDGGNGDAVDLVDVGGIEATGAVDPNSALRARAAAGDGDVDRPAGLGEVPEGCGVFVAERRACADG
jgi:hypothetical protein